MLKRVFIWILFFLFIHYLLSFIQRKLIYYSRSHRAYQYSTIQALMQGMYDGKLTISELKKQGDFGLGTFNGADGEMIVLDGQVFRMTSEGMIEHASEEMYTPFAIVTHFQPEKRFLLDQIADLHTLETILQQRLNPNHFWFVRIDGSFPMIKTRSIAKQCKPYPPLAEAIKKQKTFSYHNVHGTLIGVYAPAYAARFNLSGFHFHFISHDRKAGGHVLEMAMQQGVLRLDAKQSIEVEIPQSPIVEIIDFTDESLFKRFLRKNWLFC